MGKHRLYPKRKLYKLIACFFFPNANKVALLSVELLEASDTKNSKMIIKDCIGKSIEHQK
jgi:hypothetical protein